MQLQDDRKIGLITYSLVGGGSGAVGGGRLVRAKELAADGRLDAKLTLELLSNAINLGVALAGVEQLGVVDRLDAVGQASTTSKELIAGDGLVVRRLVHNGCLVGDKVSGDGGVDAVVLVRVVLDDGLHNVVDVVVDVLLDDFATVNNLAVDGCLGVLVLVLAGNRGEQSCVLVGRGVSLVDTGDGVDLLVGLLGSVLRVEDWLSVVLNVVDVTVVLLLASHLLNLVALVNAVGDGAEVLNILINLAVVEVEVLVGVQVVASLVADGAILGVHIARATKAVLDLVGDLLTGGLGAGGAGGAGGAVGGCTVGGGRAVSVVGATSSIISRVDDGVLVVVVVGEASGSSTGSEATGASSGTGRAEVLLVLDGRARVGSRGGRRRETAVVGRRVLVVVRMRLAGENLLDGVHDEAVCCADERATVCVVARALMFFSGQMRREEIDRGRRHDGLDDRFLYIL